MSLRDLFARLWETMVPRGSGFWARLLFSSSILRRPGVWWLSIGLALICIGVAIYARLDDWKRRRR